MQLQEVRRAHEGKTANRGGGLAGDGRWGTASGIGRESLNARVTRATREYILAH